MRIKCLAFCILIISTGGQVHASGSQNGNISYIYINDSIPSRVACFQMNPALSGTGYACLYTSHPFYQQIFSVLLTGYSGTKSCVLGWGANDSGGNKIIIGAGCS